MPDSLIKIFHKHGVKGIFPKPMKNLMIYLNSEKKFLSKDEFLVKQQIDNSVSLGWKKEDIIMVTNFPYEYQVVKSTVLDDGLFRDINDNAWKTNAIFQLLQQDIVKEAELWWYHDLNVFQLRPIDSSQIDLEDTTASFIDNGTGKLNTSSFFFRKESDKLFEWIRNRALRRHTDEAAALESLSETNYRNINIMYKRLKLVKIFKQL